MDACVSHALFDEALDLFAFVTALTGVHPDIPVLSAAATHIHGMVWYATGASVSHPFTHR